MPELPLSTRYLSRILLAFAVIAVLSITKQLLIPLFFSIFLAYLLYPAASWFEKKGIPRIITNFLVIIIFMAIITGVLVGFIKLLGSASNDLPELRDRLSDNLRQLQNFLSTVLGISSDQIRQVISNGSLNFDFLTNFIETGKNILIALALVPVYTFLLLFYRDKFHRFIFMQISSNNESYADEIIQKTSEVVPKYLKGLLVVCLILVVLNSLGFYITGVSYPLLLGIIAALFNLIPYLGTVIGYGIVALFVFAVQSPTVAGAVVIQFFIVQFLENNILTPNITGSYVRINPLVIIFSLIAGGLIWGLPGMFLIIPSLGILKIIFESVDRLKPYAYLLGTQGTEQHSITITSLRRIFGWSKSDQKNSTN